MASVPKLFFSVPPLCCFLSVAPFEGSFSLADMILLPVPKEMDICSVQKIEPSEERSRQVLPHELDNKPSAESDPTRP